MYTDEMIAVQEAWGKQGLFLMRELLSFMGAFARAPELKEHERANLGMLLTASARSSESAFLLMIYGQLWDAEVVVRSVFEASLKFAFIVQNREDFSQRFKEYTKDQFELALMKDDQKARDLLANLRDPEADQWRPIRDLVLPDAKRDELRARYDKPTRRAMETRWGYVGILESLSRSGDPFYKGFSGLSYSYSVASHIQHADYSGVSIAMDRETRSPERRDSAHMAHLVRLISDCFTCFELRLRAAYRFAGCDKTPLNEVAVKIEEFRASMNTAHERWMEIEYGSSPIYPGCKTE
ncbi:hypothetical protein KY49_5387 [Burkholderia sp. MSHR3999]|uniref:DUF5677 domain-containing protein n=1 Tax=Burkholderia sp. MSHR3999 TaxID=1542965 RepID=UPI0005B6BAF4|nr:DUF5677 domain-containing protein [Burkholderia sp. MSHR3999]KIP15314.1 hypothetical protein KY49_5387 [Burkholderia sp. MSHR3999]